MITGFKIRMPTAKDFSDRLQKAQKFVDSEVLRKSDPYVPFKTGMLRDSGVLGTKIGSGRIRYLHASNTTKGCLLANVADTG